MAVTLNIPSQVKTYANLAAFPASGSLKTIYIAEDTNKTYRWTGSVYVEISGADFSGYVPTSRTLTINGTTQDLSANRTFTIPTDLTIGTTPIASGTIGRVLFQGTGNVLQQSSQLSWDNSTNALTLTTGKVFSGYNSGGTASDALKLELTGSGAVLGIQNSNASGFSGVEYLNNTGSPRVFTGFNNSNGQEFRFNNFATNGYIDFLIGGTSGFRLFTTRNVGIGTTTDGGFKLDVNGTARVSGNLTIATGFQFLFNNTNVGLYRDANTLRLGGFGGIEFLASAAAISSQTIRMKIFDTGNVAINTTTDAGFKLDVNGTARLNGNLTFQTTSWVLDNGNAIMHRGGFNVESIAFNSSRMVFTDNNGFVFNGSNSGATLTASSILDIQSTTKGFLPPRMTTTQKNAIASPATGLQIYDTTLNRPCFYDGTTWITL